MDRKMQEAEELMPIVRNKLMEKGLIAPDETIRLTACHDIVLDSAPRNHYVIQCSETGNRFFLKLQKKVDNIIHCDEYIQAIYQNEDYALPHVLVSPFSNHLHIDETERVRFPYQHRDAACVDYLNFIPFFILFQCSRCQYPSRSI